MLPFFVNNLLLMVRANSSIKSVYFSNACIKFANMCVYLRWGEHCGGSPGGGSEAEPNWTGNKAPFIVFVSPMSVVQKATVGLHAAFYSPFFSPCGTLICCYCVRIGKCCSEHVKQSYRCRSCSLFCC